MKLIICEKPSVAREFAKALQVTDTEMKKGFFEGDEHYITWCVGHLVTMSYPEKYDPDLKEWSMEPLPFLPDRYLYEVIPEVQSQYKVVSYLLNKENVDTIYYAGDAAREGEYIGRLIRMLAGVNKNAREYRVWIDSQTEEEILRGIKEAKPLSEYDSLADAGFMRAIEDYLFGINLSRAYTLKYGNLIPSTSHVIAVGRVMSCVLGMIVDRERTIRNTKEIPFYGLKAELKENVAAEWKVSEQSAFWESPDLCKQKAFYHKENAELLKSHCEDRNVFTLKKKEVKNESKSAPLLYNLAELQGECSSSLKISPDETLNIVQSLYEKKIVTYPRTDARVLSSAVAKEILKNLQGLKNNPNFTDAVDFILTQKSYEGIAESKYVDDSKVSDHYAIIPTGERVRGSLTENEQRVYEKIVKRFLSIFYPAAVYQKIEVTFENGPEKFHITDSYLAKAGYLQLYGKETTVSDTFLYLESLLKGSSYDVTYQVTEGKSSPPSRYTTGSMVLAMENAGQLIEDAELREQIKGSGIGTSATRADVIKKLITRKYIACNEKTQVITPTRDGEIIFDILNQITPSLLNPKMTASWEKGLTGVQEKQVTKENYHAQLQKYIRNEVSKIKTLDKQAEIQVAIAEIGKVYGTPIEQSLICPCCGRSMKKNTWGYGCIGYKDANKPCRFSVNLKIAQKTISDAQIKKLVTKGKTDLIKGFTAKSGKNFDAYLVVNKAEQKVDFEFKK